jgi:fumarate hydratase class I
VTNISQKTIHEVGYNLLAKTAVKYPKNYLEMLLAGFRNEESPASKSVIGSILQNIIDAAEDTAALCQDTGIPTFHIYLNPAVTIAGDLQAALTEATERATEEVPIRKNVIEPFTFQNPGTNTGWGSPFIYYHYTSQAGPMKIRAELKGFGGEIKSSLDWVFTSTEDMEKAVLAYVLNSVLLSKGEDCIPGLLGVGVGGYAAEAFANAKNAVFRELTTRSTSAPTRGSDSAMARLERRLFERVNELGLGPMGGGGRTSTLGVYLERRGTHTAVSSLAVSHQCWASRGSEALLDDQGVSYITPHLEREDLPGLKKVVSEGFSSSEDRNRTHELPTPISDEDLMKLKVWDVVYLNGILCTARDGAHRRMIALTRDGRQDEIPREVLDSGVVFHCGPVMAQEADRWCVHAAGPTTSSRFTNDAAYLVEHGVIKAAVGKGTMGGKMIEALRGKGVYLRAVGGCAVSYKKMISRADVHWLDLGYPEAIWVFEVHRFGPLIVGIDAHGNSLAESVMNEVYESARRIYFEEGMDPRLRYCQYPLTIAGMSLEEVISGAGK